MSAGVRITVDSRQFQSALTEYAAATNKTIAEAENRQMKNLAIKGVQASIVAQRGAIESLESKPWWPKLIARIASKRAAAKVAKRIEAFTSGKQKRISARGLTIHYTREQARRISRSFIRKRIAAITFMRFFFVAMAKAFGGTGPGKQFKDFRVVSMPATNSNKTASCTIAYEYKQRSARTAAGAEGLLQRAIDKAFPAVVQDMIQYTEKKLQQAARRASGIGRAA